MPIKDEGDSCALRTEIERQLRALPIEEKIKLLSDAEKRYLSGYIDYALRDAQHCEKV